MNQDYKIRDEIIEPYYTTKDIGGIRRFKKIPFEIIKELVEKNFASKNDAQNLAPSLGEIMDWMEENKIFTAHGYSVSQDREDYRVTIEGVECIKPKLLTDEIMEKFEALFADADTINLKGYCWFD